MQGESLLVVLLDDVSITKGAVVVMVYLKSVGVSWATREFLSLICDHDFCLLAWTYDNPTIWNLLFLTNNALLMDYATDIARTMPSLLEGNYQQHLHRVNQLT